MDEAGAARVAGAAAGAYAVKAAARPRTVAIPARFMELLGGGARAGERARGAESSLEPGWMRTNVTSLANLDERGRGTLKTAP
ncbi:hypothetical protein GCM10009736_19490 [Actinomadura bangladeshensis]